MVMPLKRKKLFINERIKIFQHVENNPAVS
jgi:hypothetical protein